MLDPDSCGESNIDLMIIKLKILFTLILGIFLLNSFGQGNHMNPYFPDDFTKRSDWKFGITVYGSQEAGSNSFTNEFFNTINNSEFISEDLIDSQIDNMSGSILSGQISSIGFDALLNSKNKPGDQYIHFGFEHQHFLDTYLDQDLVKLVMKGNKPFAGETLYFDDSKYYNVYFNRIKGGMGHIFGSADAYHRVTWSLGFNVGQNFDFINVENSSLYTDPQGDYLDITAIAETKLSDTVWAEVYQINGLGGSVDLDYSYTKTENFHIDFSLKNLGVLFWNGNTFTGTIDTTFRFEGISNDTVNSGNDDLPDDYSYNGLRRLIFTDPESSTFSDMLPLSLRLSAGKYISGENFYIGFNTSLYPTLKAIYNFEVFGTWNYKSIFYLTPVVKYGSYNNFNFGLSLGVKVAKKLHIYAGTAYLNSIP